MPDAQISSTDLSLKRIERKTDALLMLAGMEIAEVAYGQGIAGVDA